MDTDQIGVFRNDQTSSESSTVVVAGALLHVSKAVPAPNRKLHRDLKMAAKDPRVPKPVPQAAQGRRQHGIPDSDLEGRTQETGGE